MWFQGTKEEQCADDIPVGWVLSPVFGLHSCFWLLNNFWGEGVGEDEKYVGEILTAHVFMRNKIK
jgi:hypothetical protein